VGVLDGPWEGQPSHVRLGEFVRRLLSASFRREVRARRARDAEHLLDRLDVGTRLFVRDLYNEQLADQDEYRLKPDDLLRASGCTSVTRLVGGVQSRPDRHSAGT